MAASVPVWIGGLALDVTENILLDLFNKFGPVKNVSILRDENGKSKQHGVVNFWSAEVAEAAALGMDGCDVLGQVVETKSAKELTKNGKPMPSKAAASQEKDTRKLADCAYFIDKRDCPFKAGQCPYRHSAKALLSNTICEQWKNKQCDNLYCPSRHPKSNMTIKYQTAQPPRCPSHNAFKCTGECGSSDCDTHFMEMDAMTEHIRRGRERRYLPSGACAVCKAVFFSEEERKRHTCLTPKHPSGEPIKIPLYHPAPSYNLPTPQPLPRSINLGVSTCVTSVHKSLTSSTSAAKPIITCSSCGTCYEHSGDSLSSFDCGLEGVGFGGHQCPNSPSVRSLNKEGAAEPEPIGVFWDIENCPVPRGKSALDVVRKIREVFFANKREVDFMCVCDISKEKKEIIEDLNKAQVTVVHINATSKNAADDKLRQSLRRFAQSYPPPATVILVSGDINFAAELSDLRHRHNLRVICLHNAQAQEALLACAHETRRYDLFTADMPITVTTPTRARDENGLSSELTILNLPVGKDVTQIKSRLKKLSDNCGGRVASVTGRTAVIRFANHLSAARAKKRMDGEDVFGSIIQAIYSLGNSTSPVRSPLKTRRTQPLAEKQDNSSDTINGPSRLSKFIPVVNKERHIKPIPVVQSSSQYNKQGNVEWNRYVRNAGMQNDGADDECLEEFTGKPLRVISQTIPTPTATATQSHPSNTPYLNNAYPTVWQHPYYQGVINLPSQGGAFPSMTPLTMPMLGAPHLTASWLASLHNFTVLDQQRGGIDILVSNLDENVSKKELKKKLASVFREHCKVYSVVLHVGEGMPLRAFIKVPKLSDAQIAMSKVHNQQLFNTCVTVTIATEKEKELCFLRCEITSVLKEAPLHWMPLTKFLSDFYEKCSHAFDMSALSMLPDLVVVLGKPGSQAICLVTHVLGSVKVVIEQYTFAEEVHNLLKQYKGNLLLVNFAASYWIKFDRQIIVGENGVSLSEALERIPNVCVMSSEDGRDVVTWSKMGISNGGIISRLIELSSELQELLKAQPEFKLPLSHLISAYQKWFNRRLPFDPMNYGFSSIRDLLDALPCVIKVVDDGIDRYVILTPSLRVKVFEQEVRILLECQPRHSLLLVNFMSAYQKCFGHKCRVTDYGFDRLVDLMEAIKHAAKMQGTGDTLTICLVDTASYKANKAEHRMTLHILSRELKALLGASESQRLPVSKVMLKYYEHYGRHFKIGECGFTLLEDVLESVIGVQLIEVNGEKYVTLPVKTPSQPANHHTKAPCQPKNQVPKPQTQPGSQPPKISFHSIAKDIMDLVSQQDGQYLVVSRLSAVYRKHFNKKLPLTFNKLVELVENQNTELQIKGKGVDQILCLPTKSEQDQKRQALDQLAHDISMVLVKFPGCQVARNSFPDIFARHKGHGIKPKQWGYANIDALLDVLCDVVEIVGSGDLAAVCLRQEYLLCTFARDIVHLLQDHSPRTVPLCGLNKLYEKSIGHGLRSQLYGFDNLSELLNAVTSVIQIIGDAPKQRIRLSPLQTFAIETKQLMLQQEGCVSLNRFAPCFQQLYSRPCRAADYGYSRMAEVLGAVSHLVDVRGDGAEKVVILTDKAEVLLDHIGPEVKEQSKTSTSSTDDSIPVKESSDSDAASVLVEEEEDDQEEVKIEGGSGKPEDLIFTVAVNGHAKTAEGPTSDWMMTPVPTYLPEPDLYPSAPPVPHIIGDLISFTEFDTELAYAGLDPEGPISNLTSKPNHYDVPMSRKGTNKRKGSKDLDTKTVLTCETGGRLANSKSVAPAKERPHSLATEGNSTPMKTQTASEVSEVLDGSTVMSPGLRQLSEVEAEILNSSGSSSPVDVPPIRQTLGSRQEEGTTKQSAVINAGCRGKKSVGPKVKLAVNFTMVQK